MPTSSVWVNGQDQSSLGLPDRGLEFGDGLFETLLCHQGRPLFLNKHIARLERGFQILGFALSEELVRERIAQACAHYATFNWVAVRITFTRGAGERGYAPSSMASPNVIVRASELEFDCGILSSVETVMVERVRHVSQGVLAGTKHLNRLEQVLAAKEAAEAGFKEGVVKNDADEIVSVIAGNIFTVSGGVISTPPAADCPVRGTRRSLILNEWAPRLGLVIEERTLLQSDLEKADEVFYSNAIYGLRAISTLGEWHWTRWPVANQLFNAYLEDLR